MEFWILLWKTVFIVTVLVFAGMAVWVTIGGWVDIRELFRELSAPKREEEE